LGIDHGAWDEASRIQNRKLGEARRDCSGIDEFIGKLESTLRLSDTEDQRPVTEAGGIPRNE